MTSTEIGKLLLYSKGDIQHLDGMNEWRSSKYNKTMYRLT